MPGVRPKKARYWSQMPAMPSATMTTSIQRAGSNLGLPVARPRQA